MQIDESPAAYIKSQIRTVPDWPAPGVQFRDITPLLKNPRTLRVLIDVFVHRYMAQRPDYIAGLDARGFILGSILAYELNIGFIPIRKKGKLPYQTVAEEYELEYGSATVEIHADACGPGDRVLLIEDGRLALDLRVDLPRPRRRDAAFAALEQRLLDRVLSTPGREPEESKTRLVEPVPAPMLRWAV